MWRVKETLSLGDTQRAAGVESHVCVHEKTSDGAAIGVVFRRESPASFLGHDLGAKTDAGHGHSATTTNSGLDHVVSQRRACRGGRAVEVHRSNCGEACDEANAISGQTGS
jgi:hypothetical protein